MPTGCRLSQMMPVVRRGGESGGGAGMPSHVRLARSVCPVGRELAMTEGRLHEAAV